MNSTFYPYAGIRPESPNDDHQLTSAAFGALSTPGDLDNYLSWDFDNETTAAPYDFYGTAAVPSSLTPMMPAQSISSLMNGLWDPSDSHVAAATSRQSMQPTQQISVQCPTCQRAIRCDGPGETLHDHIVSCFLERHRHQLPREGGYDLQQQPQQSSGEGNHLSQIQKTISRLDIDTRLRLMNSLYRLSKSQAPGKHNQTATAGAMGQSHQDARDPIMALMYANKPPLHSGEPGSS